MVFGVKADPTGFGYSKDYIPGHGALTLGTSAQKNQCLLLP